MATAQAARLTAGPLLVRNVVWNLVGQTLPMIAGLAVVPPLVHGLGVARFGLLSLAWVVVGYFGLFDLGLGRALTKVVADDLADHSGDAVASVTWTAVLLLLLLGGCGAVIVWLITPRFLVPALSIAPPLRGEAVSSLRWLGIGIPVITVTSALRGVLEARQQFRIVNLIRIPMSIVSLVGPVLVLPFSRILTPVVIVLVATRIAGAVGYFIACLSILPELRRPFAMQWARIVPLVTLGGWMTVTNVVGPLMAYLDRFFVGMILSADAIGYYSAPFDVITRILVFPFAIVGVLFPAFAESFARDRGRAALLLSRGTKYVLIWLFPVLLVVVTFATEGLTVWLGPGFASRSASVARWIAVGVFANALAQFPFGLLQAAGRPDVTAKLHLVELPLYLSGLWLLTRRFGIEGTAAAWTARTVLDATVLFALLWHYLPESRRSLSKLAGACAVAFGAFYAGAEIRPLSVRLGLIVPEIVGMMILVWFTVLGKDEKRFLFAPVRELARQMRLTQG